MNNSPTMEKPDVNRLALRPKDAAKALGVSPRTLWAWTSEGAIPHIRRGKAILYPTAVLNRWLDEQVSAPSTLNSKGKGGVR